MSAANTPSKPGPQLAGAAGSAKSLLREIIDRDRAAIAEMRKSCPWYQPDPEIEDRDLCRFQRVTFADLPQSADMARFNVHPRHDIPIAVIIVPRPSGPANRMSRAKIGRSWLYGMIKKAGTAWSTIRPKTRGSCQT